MNQDSRIYISGHTGLVGRNLLTTLAQNGYTNLIYALHKNIDLQNQYDVEMFFREQQPEYVFNCSAHVGGIQHNIDHPFDMLFDNLQIQNNIIGSSIKFGVKKFVNLGSSCIYPRELGVLREEDLLTGLLEPTNEGYAIAKIAGLKLGEYANKQFSKTKFINIMPCNLYGPEVDIDLEKAHVLSSLVKKIVDATINEDEEVEIWGSGNQQREFLYVDDLIDCMVWAIKKDDFPNTFLNVGSGVDISIIDLAEKIKEFSGYKGILRYNTDKPEGMIKKCLDVTKINNLGWSAKTKLDDGIKICVKEYMGSYD